MRITILLALLSAALACAQNVIPVRQAQASGQSVTAAFEGWFPNGDGTFSILFGYYNRNTAEELDIPVGPLNHMEPGDPDRGQPTHFLLRRQWGVFTVNVPADFGTQKLTWSITANGQETHIPASLDPLWQLSPFVDATNNTPPYVSFARSGPFSHGPAGPSESLSATVGAPLALEVWVADDANLVPGATRPRTPPVSLTWTKFRGPGEVAFANNKPLVDEAAFAAPAGATFTGAGKTTATFQAPGEYVLRVAVNDWSGDGGRGFQCCWSNAQIKVSVAPAH